jgi:spore maturation protein CgeB
MRIVIVGLSISSSWGNGHATTYRALVRALAGQGHDVLFLERDAPWYAEHRDAAAPEGCRLGLYQSLTQLKDRFGDDVRAADAVIVGSYVPQGVEVGQWVTRTARGVRAFYDIDTPITLQKLERGDEEYVSRALIARYDLYLSFTGGPTLDVLERRFGSPRARHLPCAVDPEGHAPVDGPARWDLGYLGTYSADRQGPLDQLLLQVARQEPALQFVVAGPSYPPHVRWPSGVERIDHVAPAEHAAFYGAQRFTLNLTRAAMRRAGWSPSVRLFEAASTATPILSDCWDGIGSYFRPGEEILLVSSAEDVRAHLHEMGEAERREMGWRARERVLRDHTSHARARQLVQLMQEAGGEVAAE